MTASPFAATATVPALLQRTPYGLQGDVMVGTGREFAKRGLAYIVQCCRGTDGSEGTWEPNVNERNDGIDTLNWMNEQPWIESIGYFGGSYLALTGWILMDSLPEKGQKIMGYVIDMIVLFVLSFLMVKSHAYVNQVFGQSGRPTPILRIPYTLIYGVAPYGCALMMVSYILSKYLPKFIKDINIDVEADKEVDAQ